MNWAAVLQYAVSGAIVSWPVFVAGLVVSHRKTRQHVDRVTAVQTEKFETLTAEQTWQLEHADRGGRAAGRYHGHGEDGSPGT